MNGFGAEARPLREGRHGDYETPAVRDLGSLTEITADKGLLLDLTRMTVSFAAMSNPLVPGPGGGNNDAVATTTPEVSAGEVLGNTGPGDLSPGATPDDGGAGASEPSGSSGGAGGGSSGGGGSLPFTGLAVMGIAAVGAAAAGAGATLRRALQRGDGPSRDS